MGITDRLFERMVETADEPALEVDGRIISYGELLEKAMLVATGLIENGATSETIGLVGQRKASSYIGLLGIIFAGCSFTPINPKYNDSRIKSMLDGSKIRYLVGDPTDLSQLDPSLLQTIKAQILPEGMVQTDSGLNLIDEQMLTSYKALTSPRSVSGSDLAYVNYTSGSTGLPKGVMISHKSLQAFLHNMLKIYQLNAGFRASQTFDLSFDPSVSDIFFTWVAGGTLCVVPEKEMLIPTDFIIREKITFWNSVPSIANFMLKTGNLKPGCFPMLTHSMFCGEQFPVDIAKAWRLAAPNSSIENLYGPTETTIYISRYSYSKNDENQSFKNNIVPIGLPFEGHEVALIDDKAERISGFDKGEIVFSGPQLANGYLNDADKTADSFVLFDWDIKGQIWYKTGDLGFFNSNNDLECTGRIDNQIKISGRRIEIGEIESVLSAFDKTKGAVVVPLRDSAEVVSGCAAFVLVKLSREDVSQIRQQSVKFLDSIFFPKKIFFIEDFPRSQSGKIDRKALEKSAKQLMSL
ncbi:amino acid adenylation domain-containing protein [Alphaproteobacteria bacterium]|nr:amino acid adenylation domain-containing protein [Alphaproteobacteria bacterium]